MTASPAAGSPAPSDGTPTVSDTAPVVSPEISVTKPTAGPHYPQADTHTWGAFAFLAIESDGYGDLEAVDPYSGRELHTYAWHEGNRFDGAPHFDVYKALRQLIDAMEQVKFLG
jgi:hypothetical protein